MSEGDEKKRGMIPGAQFFLDRLWIWATGIFFSMIGIVGLSIFTPIGTNLVKIWGAPATLSAVQMDLTKLRTEINAVTGDNRVIRQTPGLSYVTEPVHVGEPVVLNLVAERTQLGANCVLMSAQSLFTESGGVITPGSPVIPARQIGEEQTRMRILITPPDNLQPGRVELYLALEYECEGRRVMDKTDTVVYSLMPAK